MGLGFRRGRRASDRREEAAVASTLLSTRTFERSMPARRLAISIHSFPFRSMLDFNHSTSAFFIASLFRCFIAWLLHQTAVTKEPSGAT
jgi:hypothetical protein